MTMRRLLFHPLLAIVIGSLSPIATHAEDWAQWRGSQRNGISREKKIALKWSASGPKQLWKAKVGQGYSTITVQKGRLFTMGSGEGKDTVYCININTGKTLWKYSYAHPERKSSADPHPAATASTPVIDSDRVYTLSREGLALCLDVATGDILWQKDLAKETDSKMPQFGFTGAPLILGEKVIYNVGDHGAAFNKATGSLLWKSGGGPAGYTTPVYYQLGKQKGVALFNTEAVSGVDIETGKPFWSHKWETRFNVNAVDPVFLEDGFFISAFGRAQRVRVVENTPTVAYESRNMQNSFVSPILKDGYFYGNSKSRLLCMDAKTGEAKWDATGMGSGALIGVGDYLLALNESGDLILAEANPAKYVELARARVLEGPCWMQPAFSNQRLYCRNIEGDIVCLDMKP